MDAEKPSGCANCAHAAFRFNGGRGATTCDALHDQIVSYGRDLPAVRPDTCPLDGEGPAECEDLLTQAQGLLDAWCGALPPKTPLNSLLLQDAVRFMAAWHTHPERVRLHIDHQLREIVATVDPRGPRV